MPHRNERPPSESPALDELIRQVERQAAVAPNRLNEAIVAVRAAIAAEADPYLLVGVMLEAIATIVGRVPADTRHTLAFEVIRLLCQRLRDRRVL